MAVGSYIRALGLRDLRDVHANAGEADGLSGSGTGIGAGHLLDVIKIDAAHDGGRYKNQSKGSHTESVTRLAAALQLPGRLRVHQETTGVVFSGRRMVLLH